MKQLFPCKIGAKGQIYLMLLFDGDRPIVHWRKIKKMEKLAAKKGLKLLINAKTFALKRLRLASALKKIAVSILQGLRVLRLWTDPTEG